MNTLSIFKMFPEVTPMQTLLHYMLALHGVAAALWIGGMFFAYVVMRPAAIAVLEPPLRLQLFQAAFSRFFKWVWLFILILLLTGYFGVSAGFGGFTPHLHIMHTVGLLMCLLFIVLFFALYLPFSKAVEAQDFPKAGGLLAKIRWVIFANLLLGIVNIVVGISGAYLIN